MSLDYGWTCSYIDNDISSFKEASFETCKWFVESIYSDEGIDISEKDLLEKSKELSDELYSDAEDIFENTRSHNEDMRKAADLQISVLKEEIEDLEGRCHSLEEEVKALEKELEEMSEWINY